LKELRTNSQEQLTATFHFKSQHFFCVILVGNFPFCLRIHPTMAETRWRLS